MWPSWTLSLPRYRSYLPLHGGNFTRDLLGFLLSVSWSSGGLLHVLLHFIVQLVFFNKLLTVFTKGTKRNWTWTAAKHANCYRDFFPLPHYYRCPEVYSRRGMYNQREKYNQWGFGRHYYCVKTKFSTFFFLHLKLRTICYKKQEKKVWKNIVLEVKN